MYYDKNIDGHMEQEIIYTIINNPEIDIKTHSNKVTDFNKNNNVFFTQDTKIEIINKKHYIITYLLFANGRKNNKLPEL